jgi:hypothetical protein
LSAFGLGFAPVVQGATEFQALNDRLCKEDTTVQKGTERNANVTREPVRAVEDERIWVLLNHVKADKWEQHEHFVHDVLVPAMEEVEPCARRHTRFLHPAEQNEDGTYTSVFLMDPLVEDAVVVEAIQQVAPVQCNGDAHLKRQVTGREVVVAIMDGRLDDSAEPSGRAPSA